MAITPEAFSKKPFHSVADYCVSDLGADSETQPSRAFIVRASYDDEIGGLYFLSPAR